MPTFISASSIDQRKRLLGISACMTLAFALLFLRLVQLQVLRYDELSAKAQDNYTRDQVIVADRGTIYDRKGRVLATNRPTFDAYLLPRKVSNTRSFVSQISVILELDALDRLELTELINSSGSIRKKRLAEDISKSQVAALEALNARLGGLSIKVRYQRLYPEGEVGAHLVGYLGNPNAKEVRERKLYPNQMVGRYGAERLYDHLLQGQHGVERFVVNVKGKKVNEPWAQAVSERVAYRKPPSRGRDLVLSVDAHVQSILYRALDGYESGSIVLMDPRTGELLGSVSKPSFDPNVWSGRLTKEVKRSIDENPYKPLIDKSVNSFFPGSIYKVVTALAAMEEGGTRS